ncbi:AAA domain [Carpediemonas membranifera]|uniref:AAA domain n=1 Tax=Carpediemonas membranifera TaxID=201153 RepID=A0A8J6BEZ7_9EUKA|nr:AAA domain [Carpediemonas membranifera]|eukprot:KAG9396072.1 AAA domain [Carpediemonas membranifera]
MTGDALVKWIILFTKHKTQRRKVWEDGTALWNPRTMKFTVYTEAGMNLDSGNITEDQLEDGAEFELGRHLIQLDCLASDEPPPPPPKKTAPPAPALVAKKVAKKRKEPRIPASSEPPSRVPKPAKRFRGPPPLWEALFKPHVELFTPSKEDLKAALDSTPEIPAGSDSKSWAESMLARLRLEICAMVYEAMPLDGPEVAVNRSGRSTMISGQGLSRVQFSRDDMMLLVSPKGKELAAVSAAWHGATDGRLQVTPLSPITMATATLIHLPDTGSLVQAANAVRKIPAPTWQMTPPPSQPDLPDSTVESLKSEYTLAPDQAAVLDGMAAAIRGETSTIVVRGVFGSGKSHLGAALVSLGKRAGLGVAVVSNTNAGVDAILGSLPEGLSIGRVGPKHRVAPEVQPFHIKAAAVEGHDVIGTTVASSASLSCMTPILLVDEAGQLPEPCLAVPLLAFRPTVLVLIGDPRQLPPVAKTAPFGSSVLDRSLPDPARTCQLTRQYRCHPTIAALAGALFYHGQVESSPLTRPIEDCAGDAPPIVFLGVQGHEDSWGSSLVNKGEVSAIAQLIRKMAARKVDLATVAVMSLYAAQAKVLRDTLPEEVNVSTVDAFQGQQRDIVVLSLVRTANLQFGSDPRRVNVAITRGKLQLIVVGNPSVSRDMFWGKMIGHIQKFGLITSDMDSIKHPAPPTLEAIMKARRTVMNTSSPPPRPVFDTPRPLTEGELGLLTCSVGDFAEGSAG